MTVSKDKGTKFERDIVKELEEKINGSTFKRIAGSGAIGTTLNEPLLTGDVKGSVKNFPKKFRIECKVGYGGAKQLTLKREWLDKIKKEASVLWEFPLLIGKFLGSRPGSVQKFVVMDIDDFAYLINKYTELAEEVGEMYDEGKIV